MKFNNLNIRFIDSINFTLVPLVKFPSTFNLIGSKGYFPYLFNTKKNENYIGHYPRLKYYGYDSLPIESKDKLKEWYYSDEVMCKTFNMKEEMFHYCITDTELLSRGCETFRKLYINLTGVNPFEYVTISAACKTVYLTIIPENTIGLFNDRGNECYS